MLADLAEKFASSSRRYAEVNGIERDPDWYLLKLQEEMGELTQAWNRVSGRGRPKGKTPDELKQDLATKRPTCSATSCSLPITTVSTSRRR